MTSEEIVGRMSEILGRYVMESVGANLPEMIAQLESSKENIAAKDEEIASLKAQLDSANSRIASAEFEKTKAEQDAKEKYWIANELGKFVSDIANGVYEGQEISAARRVYDLNGGSLNKRRINAAEYETEEEARAAFEKQFWSRTYNMNDYLDWLFSTVKKKA
jgi:hypothetical protein